MFKKKAQTKVMSFSIPKETIKALRRRSDVEQKSCSQIVSDALAKLFNPSIQHQRHDQHPDQRLFSVKAAAKYLGTSAWQIRQWIYDGELPAFPINNRDEYRIERADLDALVEKLKAGRN